MEMYDQISDAVWWFLHELTSRVVAESGIASDRHHIGKIILRSLKDAPDYVLQIDGATDKRETFKSVLERSVRCASGFRNFGLKYQDVIIIMGPNHLDLAIPMYAGLYLGVIVAGVDMHLGVNELCDVIKCTLPKLIFCENSNVQTVQEAIKSLNVSIKIVTFGEKRNHMSFDEFHEKYAGGCRVDEFKPADFDPKEALGTLIPTSGSTGLPKAAALTHENIFFGFPTLMVCNNKFPSPFNIIIVLSPIQWISAVFQIILSPIMRYTRVQSSSPLTPDHIHLLIKKYRPEYSIMSPTFINSLLKDDGRRECDFSSFKFIFIGGSAVSKEVLAKIKTVAPNTYLQVGFGLTEVSGMVANSACSPLGSVGILKSVQVKLVDLITNRDINEPNVSGELRIKGPSVVKKYYNNPEVTAAAFDENGWFKTGDIMYRDKYHHYYFVDRLKILLKYRNHQVSPVEIESVIIKHPGVQDVAVSGIPDEECGDLPVAFVVPLEGYNVSAQEIKDLVKASLSDTKQLRGGVVFIKELPMTSTSKVDRRKLKKMAMNMKTN